MSLGEVALDALHQLTEATPGGERREPQEEMTEAVAGAISSRHHLLAQAGTGTGKSWAYLVPAILSGGRTVVATATKALQDQLAGKDLPFLQAHLSREFDFAVLKGRSNYVCQQRIAEISGDGQLALDGLAQRASPSELSALKLWAATTVTGDRAELAEEPSPAAWAAVSVSAMECPGAARCPKGDSCFAEAARRKAAEADVTVVNLHLLGLDVATNGAILPEHDLVVIDEAHQLEDVVSDTCGFEIGAGRFTNLARSVRAILDDPASVDDVESSGSLLAAVLTDHVGRRLRKPDPDITDALVLARGRLDRVATALRAIPDDAPGDVPTRKSRALQFTGHLQADLTLATEVPDTSVAWVEGTDANPRLRVAPVDVADVLRQGLWGRAPTVLTSATLPTGLAARLGIEPAGEAADTPHRELDVGSPFDYKRHALLYCAAHLPDPRQPAFDPAMHDELLALMEAAGGRTLALFTSYRAMDAALEAIRPRTGGKVLGQRDLPKPALVEAFSTDESVSLFATMGFWQGIDVPGRTLSLVTIDRIPFPRPDEPLLQARREQAKAEAFRTIDLPRAAMLLAQGAGRLVRSTTDRGVVAIFDPRLASARSYRWDLLRALPPFKRTKDRADAERFLREVTRDPA